MVLGVAERLGNLVWSAADGESIWSKHRLSEQAGVDTEQVDGWRSRAGLGDVCWRSRGSTGVGSFSIGLAMQVQNGEIAVMMMLILMVGVMMMTTTTDDWDYRQWWRWMFDGDDKAFDNDETIDGDVDIDDSDDDWCQGCITYFTDSARNISGREVGGPVGVWRLCTQRGLRAKLLVRESRGRPEADDDLLIQQRKFCAHSCVYTEIQL